MDSFHGTACVSTIKYNPMFARRFQIEMVREGNVTVDSSVLYDLCVVLAESLSWKMEAPRVSLAITKSRI